MKVMKVIDKLQNKSWGEPEQVALPPQSQVVGMIKGFSGFVLLH